MIQSVDVGEATIGVLGIIDVLNEKADMGAAARRAVMDFPKTIDDMARDLVTGEKIKGKYRALDQKKMAALLTDDPSAALGLLAGNRWMDHAAAIGQSLRLRNILASVRPVSQAKSLFITSDLPVSSFDWHAFEDIALLLDDPLSMFSALQSGRVTRKLVTIFVNANKSIYEAIAGSVATRAIDEYAKNPKSFHLPMIVEESLSTFLSIDGIGTKIAAAIGTPKQQGQKGKPPSDVQHGTGISLAPKSAALDGQH